MLRGHQPGKHLQTAPANHVVVLPVRVRHAAKLHDAQPAPGAVELGQERFEAQHAVGDRLQLQITGGGRPVVEEEHRAIETGSPRRAPASDGRAAATRTPRLL